MRRNRRHPGGGVGARHLLIDFGPASNLTSQPRGPSPIPKLFFPALSAVSLRFEKKSMEVGYELTAEDEEEFRRGIELAAGVDDFEIEAAKLKRVAVKVYPRRS